MRDKILKLLDDYGIEYATAGKNIGKDAIAGINCPFCGDDEGRHLGIMEKYYTCWRNPSHRGTIPYLFSKLLDISFSEAKFLFEKNYVEDDFFLDKGDNLWYNISRNCEEVKMGGVQSLELDKTFKPLDQSLMGKIFCNYLMLRGFDNIPEMTAKYDLRYCIRGDWAYRIIFPIYMEGKLMSWIGRSVDKKVQLRYMDLSKEESARHPKFCLYNYDNLVGGKMLYVTEGVMDAIKLDFYGNPNVHATSIFTTSMRDEQIALLMEKSMLYDKICIMLDKETEIQVMTLLDKLSFIKNLSWVSTPFGAKDPGELTKEQIERIEND
jgi:hypothetical protein